MIVTLCERILQMYLKVHKINTLEILIRNDGSTIRNRNFEREAKIKKVIEKIGQTEEAQYGN